MGASEFSSRQAKLYPAPRPTTQRDALDEVIRGKAESLVAILEQVVADISAREQLSGDVVTAIEEHSCAVSTELMNLPSWSFDLPVDVERRRSALERQLDTLLAEERRERVDCWRDVARLKAEFRGWLKQFADASQRAKVVLPYSGIPSLADVVRSIEK